ncbi:hypothetical protein D3C71_1832520 [compost metagenome]
MAGAVRMTLAVWPLLCMAALLPVIALAGVVVGLRDGNGGRGQHGRRYGGNACATE